MYPGHAASNDARPAILHSEELFAAPLEFTRGAYPPGPQGNQLERMREQLTMISSSFTGLDKELAAGTLSRAKGRDSALEEVVAEMDGLEAAMDAEVQRRVEANKALQAVTEEAANAMLERVQAKVTKRIEMAVQSLEALNARSARLDRDLAEFKGEVPSRIQVESAGIMRDVRSLAAGGEADRVQRIEKDTNLLRRTCEVEVYADARLEQEAQKMEDEGHGDRLRRDIEAIHTEDERRGDEFRSFMLAEVASLKNGLELARTVRKETDDEVVRAIHHFTTALHEGLRTCMGR